MFQKKPLEIQTLQMADEALGFEAYLAVCSEWPVAFGGLRVAPNVTMATVETLARRMSAKLAGHGVPIGGAKGGIRCTAAAAANPAVIRAFVKFFEPWLRSSVILGKDLGASDQLLDSIYQELGVAQLHLIRAAGYEDCPARIRDLSGYVPHMTGAGVAWAADTALQAAGIPTRGARVLVQGSGRVGLGTAVRLARLGATLVGINDRFRGIYEPSGIPIEALMSAIDEAGTLDASRCSFPHRVVGRDELLSLDADVLVLAADSNVVTSALGDAVRAPILVEGANAAILAEAEQPLLRKGHRVVPDVVASSSAGALVGHQMGSGNRLEADPLWERIEKTIRRGTEVALEICREGGEDWRDRLAKRLRELGEPQAA